LKEKRQLRAARKKEIRNRNDSLEEEEMEEEELGKEER
jgi:hypothetical protein